MQGHRGVQGEGSRVYTLEMEDCSSPSGLRFRLLGLELPSEAVLPVPRPVPLPLPVPPALHLLSYEPHNEGMSHSEKLIVNYEGT